MLACGDRVPTLNTARALNSQVPHALHGPGASSDLASIVGGGRVSLPVFANETLPPPHQPLALALDQSQACGHAGGWFRNLLTRTKTNDSQELPEALEVPVEPPFLPPEAEQPGLQTMKDL